MVTPVFKDGTQIREVLVSESGERLLGSSLGVFAESESDSELHGSEYAFARSDSGWGVTAISPPAASFPAQRLSGATSDLSGTIWRARGPLESIAAENFYFRAANGEMAEVGPALPPSVTFGPSANEAEAFLYFQRIAYLTSSADLSHMLFDLAEGASSGLLWPGDTTSGARSLYAYSGHGSTHPALVGVNADGHLISSCETSLGSLGEQDAYNAMSANGATVFFTAKACNHSSGEPSVNELYARLNEVESVPISEPSVQQCGGCDTAAKQSAEFAGASQDGAKVFFLTSQELLPGASGPNLYEYALDGTPGNHVIRASSGSSEPDVKGVARVSEDGSHVYFVAAGRLTKGPREGPGGKCLAEITPVELAAEETAEGEEERGEQVTENGKCRPTQGADNLYVFEPDASDPEGRVGFVATMDEAEDAQDWAPVDTREIQTTPDGRFAVFQTDAQLPGDNSSSARQLFEYDASTEELTRISRGAAAYEPAGNESADKHEASIPIQEYSPEGAGGGVSPATTSTGLAISNDGGSVVFESSGALTEQAIPASNANQRSVYEYSNAVATGGTIGEGEVYLISDGVGKRGKLPLIGIDGSGRDIFFETIDPLVPADTDTQFDIYDARIDGGFAAAAPSSECASCESAFEGNAALSSAITQSSTSDDLPSGISAETNEKVGAVVPPAVAKRTNIRVRQLVNALKACHTRPTKAARIECEAGARRRFGFVKKKAVKRAELERANKKARS